MPQDTSPLGYMSSWELVLSEACLAPSLACSLFTAVTVMPSGKSESNIGANR